MPVIVFRADASLQIGSGHVMRCMTLAGGLKAMGAQVHFVCQEYVGDLCDMLAERGFPVHRLRNPARNHGADSRDLAHAGSRGTDWDEDATQTAAAISSQFKRVDWLVVDHYALDVRWEKALRALAGNLMVIDDLANRAHDCDILLDQNLMVRGEARYDRLVPPACARLLGPLYAMLRPQFAVAREKLRARDGSVKRILVFFGGGDSGAEIRRTLAALRKLNRSDIAIDIVGGQTDLATAELIRSEVPQANVYGYVENVASLMVSADLACGAAGSTTWERCCLGLPSVTVSLAPNQEPIGEAVGGAGAARHLGRSADVSAADMERALRDLLAAPDELARMSARAMALVDGHGVARVAGEMERI